MNQREVNQAGAVNLTNCDREPIHIPGSIQSHGCMIACDARAATVLRHSANAAAILDLAGEINGLSLEAVVGAEAVHTLRNALATIGEGMRPALLPGLQLPAGTFDVSIHIFRSIVIIEFEAAVSGQPLQLARSLIGRISDIDDTDKLVRQSARLIRGMLEYDRVMVYRFEQDGSGKVVAEAKRADLESFLGQYFPASDIPQQARILYLKNTIRIIGDASGERIPIVPVFDVSGEALDLSLAHLRSVSPIHCEYLRNMGVAASMSISVIVDGALWGLIACHHYQPRILSMAERIAAEMFGEFFSLHMASLKQKRKLEAATRARESLDRFLRLAAHHADIAQLLTEHLQDFTSLMPCDGIGLWMNDSWSAVGSVPPASAIPGLVRLVGSMTEGGIWATHALSQRLPEAEAFYAVTAGVLAIPLAQTRNEYLFFFRKELVQTLNWAGNPDKTYTSGPLGDRLTPRESFAIWKQIVHQQAQPWTDADREIAEVTRAALVEVGLRHSELMAEERSRADVRQRMLNEELNHRVKNILALIKSLVGQPLQDGRNLTDYVASLKGRIQALSFAHDQVVRGDGGGLLRDLLEAELSPYRQPAVSIAFSGPPVLLNSRAFSVMALVLHELATNAAKYGALSRPGGRLDVSWSLTPVGDCDLSWRETGGPHVFPPSRTGFGTALIDRSVPYDLDGRSEVSYGREGVTARFLLPAKHISLAEQESPVVLGLAGTMESSGRALSEDLKVLLVEDQMLIALDVESMLADHGISDVITSASAADALARLADFTPDVAILDVNLGDGTSLIVARELTIRGVPFLFATGYGKSEMIPPDFASVPVIRKPYDASSLVSTMRKLVGEGGSPA
ncbi:MULTISPECIES: HWE histidine kinase domain-containing protein [unclassified Rhizobium]|uniref:HWE histidine kinase domain-containing protein n=1 Tax=unclassified Rhizobium TaxID=2613769 RepID=UPI000713734E|nr:MULTISPECIES: HWE histidine kinase domain-containing protein [unclassified Rhizobium]KQS87788.1 signal transduction histidine kinase [Rhizobium sp. Leaf386]KQS94654.1 signal transduction histidine kinase [Rhizobium sp. Leaf391]KQU01668.1 signal transduction histidine kinase [Rhizobium sp. Leaf453]